MGFSWELTPDVLRLRDRQIDIRYIQREPYDILEPEMRPSRKVDVRSEVGWAAFHLKAFGGSMNGD